jgi:hypothetical protein
MKPQINIFVLLKCFLLSPSLWGQLSIFGDIYVSEENQLHIAFEDTYFNGGKIITEKKKALLKGLFLWSRSTSGISSGRFLVAGSSQIYHGEAYIPVGHTNQTLAHTPPFKNNDLFRFNYKPDPSHLTSWIRLMISKVYYELETSGLTTAKIKSIVGLDV